MSDLTKSYQNKTLRTLLKGNSELTDLMRAAISNDYAHLAELLAGVDTEQLFKKDMKGRTALDWARMQNNQRSIALLTDAMSKALNKARMHRAGIVQSVEVVTRTSNGELTRALQDALDDKDADRVLRILTSSQLSREVVADLDNETYFADCETKQGDTPMIRAAGLGMEEVVGELLELKCDINKSNQYGHNPLTWACLCGNADVVRLLLLKGADVSHTTAEGRTGLHYACMYAKSRVVSVLFDVMFEKFSMFRTITHPFTKFDPQRWTKYAEILQNFVMIKDHEGYTAIDLIPTTDIYSSADVVYQNSSSLLSELPPDETIPGMEISNWNSGECDAESLGINDSNSISTANTGHHSDDQSICRSACRSVPQSADNNSATLCDSKEASLIDVSSIGQSRQTQNTHDSSYFSAFLTAAFSLKTAESKSVEVYNIRNILRVVKERVEMWYRCADKETEMASPVLCWNGCGYKTKFEEMTTHVRESCSHKPTVCGDCSEVHPAYHMHHHLTRECPKRLLGCPNAKLGCRDLVQAHYMETHVNLRCPYRLAYCRLHCNKKFPVIFRDDHERNHCKKRKIPCYQCNDMIPSEDLPSHMKDTCPSRQVQCTKGCFEWFNIVDIQYHEEHLCVQECKWGCGERIGPAQKRALHEMTQCPNRPVECANNCGIVGMTARNKSDHEKNYCSLAVMQCPHHCGAKLLRTELYQHLDPWHGSCPERCVRCPSNLVGWRVLVHNREEGLIIKYKRDGLDSLTKVEDIEDKSDETIVKPPDRGDLSWCADGVDMVYIRFENRHVWLPFWTSDIVPLRIQVKGLNGENSSDGKYLCGWIQYSQLNDHLHNDCINRELLVGGANPLTEITYGVPAPALNNVDELENENISSGAMGSSLGTDSLMKSLNAFDGQLAKAKTSLNIALVRHEINEFLVAPPENITCEYCSIEIPPDNVEWHVKHDCTHVLVRCKFGCGKRVMRKQIEEHMASDCDKRNVKCPKCNADMWADELADHAENHCTSRIVECRNKCGIANLTAGTEEHHALNECENRMYTCECGEEYIYYERSDHLITKCPKKPGLCPQGCEQVITRDMLDYHMEHNCPNKHVFQNKLVPCPLKCGSRLKRIEILEHVTYNCERRLTECPFRCGNTFKKEKLGDHIRICPNRPLYCEKGMPTCKFKLHQWFYKEDDDEDFPDDESSTVPPDDESIDSIRRSKPRLKASISFSIQPFSKEATIGRTIPDCNNEAVILYNHRKNKDSDSLDGDGDLASIDSKSLSIAQTSTSVSYKNGTLILQEGLRLLSCPMHGRSLLMYAIRYDEIILAKYIIEKSGGEDLDLQDKYGDTALTMACRFRKIEFVELLIHHGADINMETSSGKTPLIEATKINCREIVEMLISAGAIVKFKTRKHAKSALDWAGILKHEELYIYLDIGSVVQTQVEEIFRLTAAGYNDQVWEIIKDGEFFTPTNSKRFQESMEEYFTRTRESKEIVAGYKDHLKELQDECVKLKDIFEKDDEVEVKTRAVYDSYMTEANRLRNLIGSRFELYDKTVAKLCPYDLEEIAAMRQPSASTRLAVLAYALLFGVLDTSRLHDYAVDMAGIKSWWPLIVRNLFECAEVLKKMRTFSWISLQSRHMAELGYKIKSLYSQLEIEAAKEREEEAHTMASVDSHAVAYLNPNNDSSSHTEVKSAGDSEGQEDEEIPRADWDSDAEDGGGGEWIKGEWVPILKKKARWWERNKDDETKKKQPSDVEVQGFKKKRNNVVVMSELLKEMPHSSGCRVEDDAEDKAVESADIVKETVAGHEVVLHREKVEEPGQSVDLPFVNCMTLLMHAVSVMMDDLVVMNDNMESLKQAKSVYDEKKKIRDMSKQRYDTEVSRCNMVQNEMNNEIQKLLTFRKRIEQNKDKLRVTKLLNQVTSSGHTVISWAAANGCYEVVDWLLSKGAPVGYNEDLMHMSANVIQDTFRLFYYHSSFAKERMQRELKKQSSGSENREIRRKSVVLEGSVLSAAAQMNAEETMDTKLGHGVEDMFELRAHREKLVFRINRLRRNFRFPVPEAAYSGHSGIVQRIRERRLLNVNFMGSWTHPSPPPPRIRVHRRLDLKGKKYDFLDIVEAGYQDFSAGILVPGQGWLRRFHELDPFSECRVDLKQLWGEITAEIAEYVSKRHRIRILIQDSRQQEANQKLMTHAIKTANFKQCMDYALQDKCSIDYETEDSLTALIVAAEENIGGLHHQYIINDDGDPVLAVCYLLDRPERAPGVNVECKNGNTPLLHACALGREHCVEALVDRHADVNRQNRFGHTALHVAAKNGSARCVRLLLDRGADPDMPDNEGKYPYDLALEAGFSDVLQVIGQFKGGFLGKVAVKRGTINEAVNCPMGCGKVMHKHEIKDHIPTCLLRSIDCPLGCGDPHIIARDVDKHLKIECPHRPHECSKCHAVYRLCDDQKHQDKKCPHRLVMCNLGCDTFVPAKEMVAHQKTCLYKMMECTELCGESYPIIKRLEHIRTQCVNRRVSCPLKCAALVIYRTVPHHVRDVCPRRPEVCKWCNQTMENCVWIRHEPKCDHRFVECELHCGGEVRAKDMKQHVKTECRHRFVPCGNDCGLQVREIDLENHYKNECMNRIVDCELGCTTIVSGVAEEITRLPAKQMKSHIKVDCPERHLRCGMCAQEMKAKELAAHMRTSCETRIVGCRLNGCAKRLPYKDREKHERTECKYRMVLCPSGCGLTVMHKKLQRHMETVCDMLHVSCTLGCGVQVRQRQLADHLEYDCIRRPTRPGSRAKARIAEQKRLSARSMTPPLSRGSTVVSSPTTKEKKKLDPPKSYLSRSGTMNSLPPIGNNK